MVEFGQEVGAARLLALMEVAHDVGLLFPHVDRFLELHFALRGEKPHRRQVRFLLLGTPPD